MSAWLRGHRRGPGALGLLALLFLGFCALRGFTDDNPYDRDVSILLLTKTIEERDAFVDLVIEHKAFKRVDVHALEEQKNLRLSKYELLVLPAGQEGLKERLNKYYESGAGLMVYGSASAKDLNPLLGEEGEDEDFLIQGSGEGSMAKLGKIRLRKASLPLDAEAASNFDIVGRYQDAGSLIRVDISEAEENYHYKILRAIVDVHNDARLRDFGSKSPSRISFYSYLGDGRTLIRQFLSLYRDYTYDVQGFYRFKLIPELEVRTQGAELSEINYSLNTNEAASILEISPKSGARIRTEVDKARQQAGYNFTTPAFLPSSISGQVFHASQTFMISGEKLRLTSSVHPRLYYGSFKQYELYPGIEGRRVYEILVMY